MWSLTAIAAPSRGDVIELSRPCFGFFCTFLPKFQQHSQTHAEDLDFNERSNNRQAQSLEVAEEFIIKQGEPIVSVSKQRVRTKSRRSLTKRGQIIVQLEEQKKSLNQE